MAKGDINYKNNNNVLLSIEDENGANQTGINSVDPQINASLSQSMDGIVSTSYADDAVIKKQAYSIRQVFTIASGATKSIAFDPTVLSFDAILEPFRVTVTAGPIKMRLIADVSFIGGAELHVFNRYGLVDSPAHVMGAYDTISDLDLGSESPLEYVIGVQSTNQSSGGGVSAGERIFTFEKDKKYYIDFDNDMGAGETVYVSLQFDWFEV